MKTQSFILYILLLFTGFLIGQIQQSLTLINPGGGDPCNGFYNGPECQTFEVNYYRDADGDGYGSPFYKVTSSTKPNGYVTNNQDCNDNNHNINPQTRWYRDADGDGYGNPSNYKIQCAPPSGYVTNNQDCNDNNRNINPQTRWYRDADGDGYGNPSSYKSQCTKPSGYVNNSQDCNDTNRNITHQTRWYRDADGDGYGNPSSYKVQCTQPNGYINNSQDCNDSNRNITPQTRWYRDADGDGYGQGTTLLVSIRIGCTQPEGFVLNNDDCDDQNKLIHPNTIWYQDLDGDGYGTSVKTKKQCTQPNGYALYEGDCNEQNELYNAGTTWCKTRSQWEIPVIQCVRPGNEYFMVEGDSCAMFPVDLIVMYYDYDKDGYGDPNKMMAFYGNEPEVERYVHNKLDCDDKDSKINPNTIWYQDTDGDGYGNPSSFKTQCTQPSGYVLNNQDCNDSSASINPTTLWYQDADGDGYGNPKSSKAQCIKPTGYVSNNSDCNDSNASLNPTTQWYEDSDSDGKGDPNSSKTQCAQPTGYVRNANDQCPSVASDQANGCPPASAIELSDRNYIYIQEPLEGVSSVTSSTKKVHSIQYFDGLGRPMQSIGINVSPNGKDIVTPIVYDEFGRQVKDYLPYASSQNTGSYIETTTAVNGVTSYYSTHYSDTTPYSEKVLEASPLNRVLQQAAPGEVWKKESGHQIEFNYGTNAANEVKRFDATTGADFIPSLADKGYYAAGQLYKTITRDENHESNSGNKHTIEEFKDKEGRVVLKRTYDDTGTRLDTYYVYDNYGNLSYVLPPKMKGSKENLAQLGYQYRYDARNRLVEKQLPGKAREYLVYDKQDRLVATQDGKLRAEGSGHWLFTKYDQFGRVLYTGISSGGTNRSTVQSAVNAKGSNNETHGGFSQDGITVPYTNSTAYPAANITIEILTVNVYDNYPSESLGGASSIEGQTVITASSTPSTKGLQTASYVKVEGQSKWMKSYTYYDTKSRPVRTYTENYLGGYTISDSKLDFRGKPEYTKTIHKGTSNATEQTTLTYFTYDHAERLVKTEQQDTGSSTKITLSENTYDELGQLTSKKVGNNLQTVDYNYNIRGWLTDINNVAGLGNDLFAFKINYDNPQTSIGNVTGLYNGNISQTRWKTANDNKLRSYGYEYDALNRINTALFEDGSTTPNSYNVRNITYDENGNIKTLNRWMQAGTLMDELSYTYDTGNRLLKVSDGSNSTHGFKDGNKEGNDYEYDENGNMIVDKNKGITNIKYNYLNLPREIVFGNGTKIEYLYDASGIKLQKKVIEGSKTTVTDYLDGYQYVNDTLQFYPHAEGYVKINEDNTINYVYNYLDHLGNVRVSYVNDNGTAKIVEESNYYPFGLRHKGYNNQSNQLTDKYKYGYNGKEWQEELGLGWIDYGARNYDPALGRWMNVDPLADKTLDPYGYVWNSPLRMNDPTGMIGNEIIIPNKKDRAKVLKMINSRAKGTFGINSEGRLYVIKKEGAEGYSSYYSNKLVKAIESDKKIEIGIRERVLGFKIDSDGNIIEGGEGSKSYNVDTNFGGGVTLGEEGSNQKVYISGNKGVTTKDKEGEDLESTPDDVLLHELVGHAIPGIIGPDTGNAIENENKARREIKGAKEREVDINHYE